MWTVSGMICLLILFVIAVWDIRVRMVPEYMLIIGAVGSVIHHLIYRNMRLAICTLVTDGLIFLTGCGVKWHLVGVICKSTRAGIDCNMVIIHQSP